MCEDAYPQKEEHMKKFLQNLLEGLAEIRHLFPRSRLLRLDEEYDPYKVENLYDAEDPHLADTLKHKA